MATTAITSDRCGDPIDAGRAKLVVQTGKRCARYVDPASRWTVVDLCSQCAIVVAESINAVREHPEGSF
jgi:hypothetical protein